MNPLTLALFGLVLTAPAPVYREKPPTDWNQAQRHAGTGRPVLLTLVGVTADDDWEVLLVHNGVEVRVGASDGNDGYSTFLFGLEATLRKLPSPCGNLEVVVRPLAAGKSVSYRHARVRRID